MSTYKSRRQRSNFLFLLDPGTFVCGRLPATGKLKRDELNQGISNEQTQIRPPNFRRDAV